MAAQLAECRERLAALPTVDDRDNCKLLYPATVSLLIACETMTWNRMTPYVTISGFIFTAYALHQTTPSAQCVLAIGGAVLSIVFILLLLRSRRFVDAHIAYGETLEAVLKMRQLTRDGVNTPLALSGAGAVGLHASELGGVIKQVKVAGPRLPAFVVAPFIPAVLLMVFAALAIVALPD
jgi:hypothetical protein